MVTRRGAAAGGRSATAEADGEGGGAVGAVARVLLDLLEQKPRASLVERGKRILHG